MTSSMFHQARATLYCLDNEHLLKYVKPGMVDTIYADMIFDDPGFQWIPRCYDALKETGSLFIHTDYRSVAEVKCYAQRIFHGLCKPKSGRLNNWIIWPYNWGGRPRNAFGRKHDDILWFVKSDKFKFYPKRVAIPKKTAAAKGFNPSGRDWQIPTDVWSDIGNFHTMDKERVKGSDGKNVRWQKPERLIERIILATTDEGDWVVDPFLGTGTTAVVCARHKRRFTGFEIDPFIFALAVKRFKQSVLDNYYARKK